MDLVCYAAADTVAPPPLAELRDELTFASWGRPLTLPQYLERERRLWRHPFSGGLRRWVLEERGAALASCETYAVPVSMGGRRGVPARAGAGHGVASVYVEERLRGRGHARALLERLHERLAAEGALCSYLISEVGPAMYERLGYVARPLRQRRFAAPAPGEPEPGLDEVEWLGAADVADALGRRYAVAEPSLTLRLTPEQIDWHNERARIYAGVLGRAVPEAVGARCRDAFVLWNHEYRNDLLRVLCLYPGPALYAAGTILSPRDPEAAALRNVLHAARAQAAHAGLGGVEIWENAQSGWLRGGQSLDGEDLPMLRPLQRGVSADDWLDWERGHWL